MADDPMKVIAAMRQQGATDGDVEAYLRQIGAKEVPSAAPADQVKRTAPGSHRDPRSFGQAMASNIANAVDAGTLGSLDELAGLTGGIGGMFDKEGFVEGAKAGYRGMKMLRKEGEKYDPTGTGISRALGVALPTIATFGAAAPSVAPTALQTARTGAAIGGVAGAMSDGSMAQRGSSALTNSVIGGLFPLAAQTGLNLATKIPGVAPMAVKAATALGNRLPPKIGKPFTAAAEVLGPQGQAAQELAAIANPSARLVPANPSLPTLALDEAGPAAQALAKNIVRRPGAAGQTIRSAITSRQEQMRPAINDALTAASGVSDDAVMVRQRMIDAQRAKANQMYDAAREATKGMPVQSQTLDEVLSTPIGKQAYQWAKIQKANRNSPLPQEVEQGTLPGFSPEQTEKWVADMQARGIDVPAEAVGDAKITELPDPETLHLMKQYLAKVSRLGVNDGQQGMVAVQAQGALGNWGKIRNELPTVWQDADKAFSDAQRKIDVLTRGTKVTRLSDNPMVKNSRAAMDKSIQGAERDVATMPQEDVDLFRTGAVHDLRSRFNAMGNSVQSPGRVFNASPLRARQVNLALSGSPASRQSFTDAVSAWDAAQKQSAGILGGSDTAANLMAEESRSNPSFASSLGSLVAGRTRTAAQQLGQGVMRAGNPLQSATDEAIAGYLTAPSLQPAMQAAQRRVQWLENIRRALLGSSASVTEGR